ncbi:MAG TPA: class I SAM-dependent methyltransferase [Bacteroidota bacterium]|nr:class I SAM-dependent methyltransferase [Bacteroidota bacterium]
MERNRVCPVERAGSLDSRFRRYLQNPEAILAPYVRPGMTALDIGCGPGFFTQALAMLVGDQGTVLAADLQEGMLEKARKKIIAAGYDARVRFVRCDTADIRIPGRVDFVLAFYMVHEVPDRPRFFSQIHDVLADRGEFLLVEPALFHVSRSEFESVLLTAGRCGFGASPGPKVRFSRSALLRHA